MPTYKIKAPDGNTYSIEGPDGATDEQVRAQVMAQHPNAGAAPKAAAPVKNVAQQETEDNSFGQNVLLGIGKNLNDTVLGGKQLINSVSGNRLFDEAKLAKEVADNKMANEAISGSGGGMVGDIGTSIASTIVPFGAATKAAKAATFLPKILKGALPTAAVGAGQGVLTPDEDYSVLGQAGTGAALNVGGDIIGRGVGRLLKPMQGMIPKTVTEHLANMPENARLLAENLTDSRPVKALSNALEQVPFFGRGITNARNANIAEGTKLLTRAAGNETAELSPSAAAALHNKVAAQTGKLSEGYVPISGMEAALRVASTDPQELLAARLLGSARPENQLTGAADALAARRPQAAGPYTPVMPAKDAMKARTELGDQIYQTQHGLSSTGAEAIKDELDAGLRRRFGNDLDKALAEHGASLDVRALQKEKGAVTSHGGILPERIQQRLPETEIGNPSMPYTKQIAALADRAASPSLAENRSAMMRILGGAPIAAGAAGLGGLAGYGSGDAATGVGVGAGSLGLASLLLGTPGGGRYLTGQAKSQVGKALQSDKAKMMARFLAAQGMNYGQGE